MEPKTAPEEQKPPDWLAGWLLVGEGLALRNERRAICVPSKGPKRAKLQALAKKRIADDLEMLILVRENEAEANGGEAETIIRRRRPPAPAAAPAPAALESVASGARLAAS